MRKRIKLYLWIALFLLLCAGGNIAAHVHLHGEIGACHAALVLFLWLNVLVAFWEICLFLHIELIAAEHPELVRTYQGRPFQRSVDFLNQRASPFATKTWAGLWAAYALFDPAYADRKSYGFFIDVGNGFSTMIPCMLLALGLTFDILPMRVLGAVGLLSCYQMWYGTVVYFFSFLHGRKYAGHRLGDLLLFVGVSNGLWLLCPLLGMWISGRLLLTGQ